ncbi:hypothetical protein M3O96_11345 [Aquiflexum sp. TKW24L]|uniref:hypothetical protein n=1 Tax=Aquiflexum sp. TKW24L TaxID=2942212 RepID=UPI0020C1533A|nr:hypothetical protein [Aquiflexum sp. TKW24L]MCL6259689.1 hypothetical protein [Aquiflexum sp. TKW24L]
MKNLPIVFLLLIFLQACNFSEDADLTSLSLESELRQIMSLQLDYPSDKLSHVLVYVGDSKTIFSTREIYYPNPGNITYHVIRNQNQDTLSIGLNYFSVDERVKSSLNFTFINHKPIWQSTREYSYNSQNLVEEIFYTSSTEIKRVLAKYYYDTQNKLTQIEYPFATGSELEIFEYDSQGRISHHWKTAKGQEESKIEMLFYRYNGNLLEAKEAGNIGSITGDRQDAFQYFYDDKGKLSMQNEFDRHFGFQQKGRSEFFYHD